MDASSLSRENGRAQIFQAFHAETIRRTLKKMVKAAWCIPPKASAESSLRWMSDLYHRIEAASFGLWMKRATFNWRDMISGQHQNTMVNIRSKPSLFTLCAVSAMSFNG